MKTYLWINVNDDGEIFVRTLATDRIQEVMAQILGTTDLTPLFNSSWPEPDPEYWGVPNLLVEVATLVSLGQPALVGENNRLMAQSLKGAGGGTWKEACPCGQEHEECKFEAGSLICIKEFCQNPHHRNAP